MPSFKPVIRTTHPLKDGKYNIKIRITHNRKVRYLKTDYHVIEDDFDMAAGKVKSKTMNPEYVDRINNKLNILIGQYALKLDKHSDKLQNMDIGAVMNILREKRNTYDFYVIIDGRIKDLDDTNNESYRDMMYYTRQLVQQFSKTAELPLESITPEWLKRFDMYLRRKQKGINYISMNMRNIRTIYNQAITMGIVSYDSYPFRSYKIPRQPTRKRNITTQEMAEIVKYQHKNKLTMWARDMFLLSFYLIGINMKDMMLLDRIEDGRIYYTRSKGKKLYSVKVFPQAQEIFDRYPGKKYLLNTMDKYSHYKLATKRINKKLKSIAEDINKELEKQESKLRVDDRITTYYARHSWATIASKIGIPRDTIAYALGHSFNNEITSIYIDYDMDKVDKANELVIEHINRSLS